jgi:hypothetical protein
MGADAGAGKVREIRNSKGGTTVGEESADRGR